MNILFAVQDTAFFKPLGLMQMSAMAKQRGDKTDLVVLSKENIWDKIREYNPDVVAYTATTGEHKHYVKVNKRIKSEHKNIFTIMGGPHATFFPEILNEADLDAICIGEGEYAFVELLNRLEKKEDISGLENILIRGGKTNGLRPLVQNLDSLPFPDRALFYGKEKMKDEPSLLMGFMTSKGCPYNCTYCFNHSYRKMYAGEKYLRSHSVGYVLNEILDAQKVSDFKYLRFMDDTFVLRKKGWLEEFSERYPKEIGLPFAVGSRFDLMTPENADLLKRAGCCSVSMAMESANPRIRKEILGRSMSNEDIILGTKYCIERGISVLTFAMVGLPTSKIEDDIGAVDLSIEAKIPITEFYIFNPFPKTRLCEMCIEKGWFDGDMSKINTHSFSSPSVLSCFTDREKNAQVNIRFLGPAVVRHPSLRNIVMNHLIYLPTNRVYERIYDIGKTLTYQSKVYKMGYSLRDRLQVLKKVFRIENAKREG